MSEEMNYSANPGKHLVRTVDGVDYLRIPIKTHLITKDDDMADVVLEPGRYAHFNVTAKRVSLCGYTCSTEDLEKFGSMTHKDELYNGKLLEIA